MTWWAIVGMSLIFCLGVIAGAVLSALGRMRLLAELAYMEGQRQYGGTQKPSLVPPVSTGEVGTWKPGQAGKMEPKTSVICLEN